MKWYIQVVFFNILLIPLTESVKWFTLHKKNPENDALKFVQSNKYITLQQIPFPVNIFTMLNLSYACPIVDSDKSEKDAESITKRSLLIQKNDLKCFTRIEPSILEIKEGHYSIGFEVYMNQFQLLCHYKLPEMKNKQGFCWFFVIDFYYKTESLKLLCAIHILGNSKFGQTNTNLKELTLGKDLLLKDVDLDYLYSEENQAKVFSKPELQHFRWETGNRLEPQFLIDPEDFYYDIHKEAAFNYANVAPMWKNIKNGSWKLLNVTLRKILHENDYFMIATGTYGILELPNEIFLAKNNKMPVPYAFWKLIRFTQSTEERNVITTKHYDIVIIVHNHPYEENPKPICPNICAEYDWNIFDSENLKTGYTYCCEANESNSALLGINDFWKYDSTPRDVFNLNSYLKSLYANFI